ncbi:MAG TPA: L,D-transpeptidase [Clostridia bacterium]|nr:L,D-transpeptidase [Clostridia bacterium]
MKKYFWAAIILFICFSQVSADIEQREVYIEINLPSRSLSLYMDGALLKEYPVCVGRSSAQTPQGEYRVVYKTVDPYWLNKGTVVPPGPQNPLGKRWLGLTKSIGIHGNNRPESIGTYASAGCIRMYNRDVKELYDIVPVNTPVVIKYDRIGIFEDKYTGKKAALVYPDSYKRGNASDSRLLQRLSEQETPDAVVEKAAELLKKSLARPRAVSSGIGIFLNESLVTCDAVGEQGKIYVNCKAAEDVLGLNAAMAEQFSIDTIEVEDTVYVNLTQLVEEYGGSISYDAAEANAYISMQTIRINGVFAGLNHGDIDKEDILELEAVKQLDYDYSEDSVDIRVFDKGIMKLKRNKTWCVNTDNLVEALGGSKSVDSRCGIVDLTLPTFLRFEEEYYKTETLDGRLAIDPETAAYISARTGRAEEAFSAEGVKPGRTVELEHFLENYEYESNSFGTVIDIRSKEIQFSAGDGE